MVFPWDLMYCRSCGSLVGKGEVCWKCGYYPLEVAKTPKKESRKLKRYDMDWAMQEWLEDPRGDWVRFEDVEELLKELL